MQLEQFFEYLRLAEKYKINFNNIRTQAQYFTKGLKNSTALRDKLSWAKGMIELKGIMQQTKQQL